MNTSLFQSVIESLDFSEYIKYYKEELHNIFQDRVNLNKMSLSRGMPPFVLRKIMDAKPLSVFIPKEHGGRGGKVHEALSMLEATSYESLPLSLMMGINGALFIQPIAKYADSEISTKILSDFINNDSMGGLMITEPDYGTDALKMRTSYIETDDGFHVEGMKHWAGLTGWADYWLVTARANKGDGNLGRDIGFFIHDSKNQGIEVEEVYNNLGLYMLPYGKNKIDMKVPHNHKLEPESTGIKMMLDILHRSRLEFPGMAMGYLRRIMDEAIDHCKDRLVNNQKLVDYDQVKHRLTKIQSYFTVSSAMCAFTTENASVDKDVSQFDLSANAIKSVITDMMHDAAQSFLQLSGANGYRIDHLAGRSLIDSRPFKIFEGSNDVLYQQITESVLKKMRRFKEKNLYEFLNDFELTQKASEYLEDILKFEINLKLPQRKMVELGRAIGRIISLNLTIELGEKGFHSNLIDNTIKTLTAEIDAILSSYQGLPETEIVEDYGADSQWINYISSQS